MNFFHVLFFLSLSCSEKKIYRMFDVYLLMIAPVFFHCPQYPDKCLDFIFVNLGRFIFWFKNCFDFYLKFT